MRLLPYEAAQPLPRPRREDVRCTFMFREPLQRQSSRALCAFYAWWGCLIRGDPAPVCSCTACFTISNAVTSVFLQSSFYGVYPVHLGGTRIALHVQQARG